MSDLLISVYLVGGLAALLAGAESLVRGSSALALKIGISPLVIGLTIVAFGTSGPELVVSIKASLDGNADIALGNVIGSNICNIGLILGTAALIFPVSVHAHVIRIDIPIMIVISVILLVFLSDMTISFFEGLIFVVMLAAFIIFSYYYSLKEKDEEVQKEFQDLVKVKQSNVIVLLLLISAGIVLLAVGADIFVKGAVDIAERFGVSQATIGLTIVAIGTSLPELITAIVAALKKESDIVIGNVIGSNIFNISSILGITALISPLTGDGIKSFDLIIMVAFSVIIFPLCRIGFSVSRIEGGILFLGYIAYMLFLIV